MDSNTFLRAQQISTELRRLSEHRKIIEDKKNRKDELRLWSNGCGAETLKDEFLPISYNDFFIIYLNKITQQITELNQEFQNL